MRLRQEYGLMKRKDSKGKVVWYYWVYGDDNKRIYRSTGERTKAKAMDYVMSLRDEGRLGQRDRTMMTLGDFATDFFVPGKCPIERNAHMRGKSMTKATLSVRRTALTEHILPHFAKTPLSSITRAKVNRWLMDLPTTDKISRSSANNHLVAFRMVMEEAVRQGLISENPCTKVENLGRDSKRRASFTTEEVRKLIGKPEDWDDPMIRLMCLTSAVTGMRMGEIRALKSECISDTAILIKASFSYEDGYKLPKNGKERVAPIPPSLRDELRSMQQKGAKYIFCIYDSEKPVSAAWIHRSLMKRMEKCGIKGKTFHSFRAYFNTEMMSANVNETVVRAVIGHQNAVMTEHYLHLETGEFSQIRGVQDSLLGKILA